jgi:hypothetical protein
MISIPWVRRPRVLIGAAFVFASSLSYALYLAGSGPAIARLGAARFTALAMLVSTLATQVHFLATQPLSALLQPLPVYAYGAAMALFSTVLPVFMQSAAIRRIGSGKAVLIGTLGPMLTILFGWWLLSEPISAAQLAGAMLVLAGCFGNTGQSGACLVVAGGDGADRLGLLAVLLVLSRTPGIQDVFPLKDLFRAALVVHVDLSVAVWFMAFAAVIWCAVGSAGLAWLGWSGFGLAALGTALMTVSPFFPNAEPVLNNYIPVLKQPLFFASLWIFAAGLSLTVLRALLTTWPQRFLAEPLRLGAFLGAVAAFLSLAHSSGRGAMVPWVEGVIYYEVLFWGGGHTLQFQHALLMVVAWLWIAARLGARRSRRRARCPFCSWSLPCRCCGAGHLSAGAGRLAAACGAVRQADALGPSLHGAADPARRPLAVGPARPCRRRRPSPAFVASFTCLRWVACWVT